ncbi:MAG TPA: hypothetical protein VFZ69_07690 [Longimicrobiales bacterium]
MRGALRARGGLGVITVAAIVAAAAAVAAQRQEFPHEEHAGLFPLCEGCHQGVPEGDRARFYPTPEQCARCHDGTEQPRVDWQGPTEHPDNVDFEHPDHPAESEGEAIECTTCHTRAGAPRMAVEARPVVPRCLDCHEHRAQDHFVDADCETCHIPLAEVPFDRARLTALPLPDDHSDEGEFLRQGHGEQAQADLTRCAVCHTRERCESCHVDVGAVAEIGQMPPAGRALAAQLPEFPADYPVPQSHLAPDFVVSHGATASRATCATCHTRDDCAACHAGSMPNVVAELPARADVRAPGVQIARRMPPSHQAPMFAVEHGTEVAVNGTACSACHARTMCVDCHDASATGGPARTAARGTTSGRGTVGPGAFHPANFQARHAAEAYGRRLECSNCHDSRLFCADCHASSGMSSARVPGRLGPGFHDAEPIWLLRHGQAARQGLESCASCHRQNECMQCHSVLGAFKVSPHGPGFDARRAQKRNAVLCLVCHITDPLNGGAE